MIFTKENAIKFARFDTHRVKGNLNLANKTENFLTIRSREVVSFHSSESFRDEYARAERDLKIQFQKLKATVCIEVNAVVASTPGEPDALRLEALITVP